METIKLRLNTLENELISPFELTPIEKYRRDHAKHI